MSSPQETPEVEMPSRVRYDQPWLVSFLRPVLIAAMVACLNIALIAFLHRLLPSAPRAYYQTLLLLGVIAAVIGVTTTTWLAQPAQRLRRNAIYRTAELVCLLVLARLLLWLIMLDLPTFSEFILHPFSSLVDGYFLLTLVVVALSWSMAAMFSDDLLSLAVQPDEIYAAEARTRDLRDTSRGGGSGRQLFLNSFVGRWVFGGVILVILVSGTQVDTANNGFFALLRQNIDPRLIFAVIVYFFAGLLLISQGQLALLRARWTIERIPSNEAILRNWPWYVLAVLVLVGILAAIMPFGGTYYFSLIISAVISALYMVVVVIINIIMLLLVLLLSFLPFSEAPERPDQQMVAESVTPPPPPSTQHLAWIGGTLFWIVTALLIGYAAYIYFGGKGLRFKQLAWLWAMLKIRWQQLFGAYHEWWVTRRVFANRSNGEGADAEGGRRWFERFNRRKLNPEQRVRYYYLALLAQAERVGASRGGAETPNQYGPRLTATLTEAESTPDITTQDEAAAPQTEEVGRAVERLTTNFVRVRYAGQTVSDGELSRLETHWKQLRSILGRYGGT